MCGLFMLEKYLDNLFEDDNYDFFGTKIDYIKQDDSFYVVYLSEKIESVGRPFVFRINKNNGEHEALFLPDENNFQFLDKFERCVSVQVPDKYLEDDFNLV